MQDTHKVVLVHLDNSTTTVPLSNCTTPDQGYAKAEELINENNKSKNPNIRSAHIFILNDETNYAAWIYNAGLPDSI